jgi:hypothetical protein
MPVLLMFDKDRRSKTTNRGCPSFARRCSVPKVGDHKCICPLIFSKTWVPHIWRALCAPKIQNTLTWKVRYFLGFSRIAATRLRVSVSI